MVVVVEDDDDDDDDDEYSRYLFGECQSNQKTFFFRIGPNSSSQVVVSLSSRFDRRHFSSWSFNAELLIVSTSRARLSCPDTP
jgi:hypothetical protein